jgi:Icc-related predicted phosphoesterase
MPQVNLLTLGDMHGRVEWSPALLEALEEADLIVVSGDLTTFGTPEDAGAILDDLESRCGGVLAIAGNCDSVAIIDHLETRGISLHAQGVIIEEHVGICGVSGSNATPVGTPLEYSEEELAELLARGWADIEDADVRVIVHHAPPHGTSGDRTGKGHHVGVMGLRTFCEQNQPDLVICGHIHEARSRDTIGPTTVVNGGMAGEGHGTLVRIRDGNLSLELL